VSLAQFDMQTFNFVDYSVIVIYLLAIVALGACFARRQNSRKEYFHGGGALPWWAVSISLLASSLSPISYLSVPGWVFLKDSRNNLVPDLLNLAFIPLAAVIWLPLWSRLRVFSIYEYLEIRFQPWIRTVGAILFLFLTTIWVGTALSTAGMGFQTVTGFDAQWCILVIAVLGTSYTVLGGVRAVIWTDVVQFVVFMVGYAAILLTLLHLFDWQPFEMWRIASTTISQETGHPHTKLISFELDPNVEATIWVVLFYRIFDKISWGASQWEVQRLHATRSRREMLKTMIGSQVAMILFTCVAVPTAWGFVAYYAQQPELKVDIQHDEVLPHFVVNHLPSVFRSLIMAGVLAALMSTMDTAINSMGSVTVNDFVLRFLWKDASEESLVRTAKLLTFVFGVLVAGFALWQLEAQTETALEKIRKFNNVIIATIPSFFLLGVISKRTNTGGAVLGAIAGMIFAFVFNGVPGMVDAPLPWINWMWIAGLAMVVNVTVGYAASYLFAPPSSEVLDEIYKD